MKVMFDKVSYPLYCDAGLYEGSTRMDLEIRLYLSAEECARYGGTGSLRVTLKEDAPGTRLPPAAQPPAEGGTGGTAGCGPEPAVPPGSGTREVRLGGPAARLQAFDISVADARRRYDGITLVRDEAGNRVAAVVPVEVADFAIRHGALR
jgi:hypothetical protein